MAVDIITDHSEFTSKLRNLAVPLVADDIMSVDKTGYAIVVKAA